MQNYNAKRMQKKKSFKFKIGMAIFAIILIIVIVIIYYFRVVCPIIVSLSEEKVRSIATNIISETVNDVLEREGVKYDDLTNIIYSSSDTVEMIEVNTIETNRIIRLITKDVQDKFDNLGNKSVGVALGTFTGIPFLYGLGPEVAIQLVPIGTITTKINSNFSSAGINQTLHRLNFVVNAGVGMILPAQTQNFNTQLEVLICENLIIGKVPQVYLQGNLI